jgi:hypothetical protein
MRRAECRPPTPDSPVDTADFYPERGQSAKKAKARCAVCPVRADCLDYALRVGEKHGVWGGFTERERRQLRRGTTRRRHTNTPAAVQGKFAFANSA